MFSVRRSTETTQLSQVKQCAEIVSRVLKDHLATPSIGNSAPYLSGRRVSPSSETRTEVFGYYTVMLGVVISLLVDGTFTSNFIALCLPRHRKIHD